MKKHMLLTALFISVLSQMNIYAQGYSRVSISPIYLQFNSGVNYRSFADSVKVPEKYDYNYFGNNTLRVNIDMISPAQQRANDLSQQISSLVKSGSTDLATLGSLREQQREARNQAAIDDSLRDHKILQSVNESKLANKILSSILIDPNQKVMTLDILAKRAEYNASDADFVKAMNSETKMAAIRDKGLDLLKNTYILLLETNNVKETASDEKDGRKKLISHSGYVHLFQIDIDTLVKTGQFDPLVFTEPDQAKYQRFQSFEFPVKLILKKAISGDVNNYYTEAPSLKGLASSMLKGETAQPLPIIIKSEEEISKDIVTALLNDAEDKITKEYKPFQVKVSVFASNPIRAKIGAKESLKIDHLFRVTENVIEKDGSVNEKKVGWVRARKVSDNKMVADGNMEPSIFYKVASGKVEKGMKLTEKRETGIVLGATYNMSKENVMSGPLVNLDYITHASPGLRIGVGIGGFNRLRPDDVQVAGVSISKNVLDFSGTNIYGELNLQKIIQANRIELTPFLGGYFSALSIDKYYLNNTEFETLNDEVLDGTTNIVYGALGGIKLGLNLGKHTQLFAGYKYGFQLGSQLKNSKDEEIVYGTNSGTITMDFQQPASMFFGLRLLGF